VAPRQLPDRLRERVRHQGTGRRSLPHRVKASLALLPVVVRRLLASLVDPFPRDPPNRPCPLPRLAHKPSTTGRLMSRAGEYLPAPYALGCLSIQRHGAQFNGGEDTTCLHPFCSEYTETWRSTNATRKTRQYHWKSAKSHGLTSSAYGEFRFGSFGLGAVDDRSGPWYALLSCALALESHHLPLCKALTSVKADAASASGLLYPSHEFRFCSPHSLLALFHLQATNARVTLINKVSSPPKVLAFGLTQIDIKFCYLHSHRSTRRTPSRAYLLSL
jgi:hypothetical protein